MSRVLSELLNANEPDFSMAISDLERLSGHPSIDVKLTAKIQGVVYNKIKELGLDPNDTTAKELYHGLQSLIKTHDLFLAQRLGINSYDSTNLQLVKIIDAIDKLPIPKKTWAIKHSVAKKLLKACPPTKLKSVLGYKSLDSMIKRENIDNLLIYARLTESSAWLKKLVRTYKNLTPADFEVRDVNVFVLDNVKLNDYSIKYMNEKTHNIVHLKEFGLLSILPLPVNYLPGLSITIMPMVLHYINEIRSYSAYFKMLQVKPNFGELVVDIILKDPSNLVTIANQEIHWRIIQRYFGNQPSENHPEMFEPHIQPEDLHWRKAESVIYWLEPALKFWEDLDYVGALYPEIIVPLSLMDNAVSFCNKLEMENNCKGFFKASLWNEIQLSYISLPSFEKTILKQLNKHILNPELVGL